MAIYLTRAELKSYPLSNGTTVDLIGLIDAGYIPAGWVVPTHAPEIGTIAYVDAMGQPRRGVVVKTTKTKVHVALTTQGALDKAMQFGWSQPVRVQISVADINHVRVSPPQHPQFNPEAGASAPDANRAATQTMGVSEEEFELTLPSQAGKVGNMNEDAAQTETAPARETTGSAVVKLLERVHERIRQNHPEVPAVVIVTGAGTQLGSAKWGHFRAKGWMVKSDPEGTVIRAGEPGHLDEMFMAGETLAKGAQQVLQTMLHESAHALAAKRGKQDTSRQGRWHNKTFLEIAREMGLEHRAEKADKAHGYSFVTLTDETRDEYRDLIFELDREIHLMVKLPFWLGGDAGENGGEGMGKKPTEGDSKSTSLKLTCLCPEPNIVRASKKVAEKLVVRCEDCDSPFSERS